MFKLPQKRKYLLQHKFSYVLLFLLLLSCSNAVSNSNWTFLVYLDADNDLAPTALADLEEMRIGSKSDNIEIYLQLDLPDGITAKRYHIKNQKLTLLEDIGEVNMADGTTLTEFLLWGKSKISENNDHTILILSDHGNGWDQGIGPPSGKPALSSRSLFMDWDNGVNNVALHNHKVREAIESADINIDILGLDASIMGTIEALYEFSSLADILISSQEVGEASGWDYEYIFSRLSNNSAMSEEEFAKLVVESYKNYFENHFYPEKPVAFDQRYTIAAHLSANIPIIVSELNNIALVLRAGMADDLSQNSLLEELDQARQNVQEIDKYNQFDVYIDIADFAQFLSYDNELPQLISHATIAEYHGKGRQNANGISVVFFNPPDAWIYNTCDSHYKNWDELSASGNKGKFIKETSWDEMLAQYYSLVIPSYDQISENHVCNTLFE